MKYYKKEFWSLMHSSNEREREEAKSQFRNNSKKYGPYFEMIKDRLPIEFLSVFNENKWFHDFNILSIQIYNNSSKSMIDIEIGHNDKHYKLLLDEVTKISIDVPNKNYWMPAGMTWGYTEFELFDDEWKINVLCDINCELEFCFKSIEIKSL